MPTEEEVSRKEKDIQKNIDYLKMLNNDYKNNVDKCNAPGISSDAMFIERWTQLINREKDYMMMHQIREMENLENQHIVNFQKLVNGHCECKPKTKT